MKARDLAFVAFFLAMTLVAAMQIVGYVWPAPRGDVIRPPARIGLRAGPLPSGAPL